MIRALAAGVLLLLLPNVASAAISCRELPKAERFIGTKLRPGPNTRLAQRHLALAKSASSSRQCSAELSKADYYARRSLAADQKHR
jgi:hypothetical protein